MKKIILATVLAGIGATSALAADIGASTPYSKAPMMAPVPTWAGFYIGGNVGYGWGSGTTNSAALASANTLGTGFLRQVDGSFNPRSKGVIGGAQIGYNWQIGSLVAGLEADIQGSDIKGSFNNSTLHQNGDAIDGSAHTVNERLSWFGTVRGRLGATVTPDLMLYGTGGFAYGPGQ